MKILVFLIAFMWTFLGFNQTQLCDFVVSGKVLDIDTNDPLPHATIQIKGTQKGVVIDENGNFTIADICENEIDLEIRFTGYKTVIHHHDFHHPNPIIYMAVDSGLLESVVIEEVLNAHELKTLKPKEIKISKASSLAANASGLLAKISGVSTLKTGQNIVKPIVHGLHSNRVLIINNGVRHSHQSWGTEHGLEIDASQIENIQLIKGASTVRYGADALGGVILFNTPQSTYNTALNGEVSGDFQTNGRAFSGEISLNQGYGKAAWAASFSGSRQGDLKAADYQLTNTGKKEFGFTANSRFHFPALDIDFFVSHFNQKLGILRGSVSDNLEGLKKAFDAPLPSETKPFSYAINNPGQETVHDLVKLETSIFIGNQQFDFQYAFQHNLRKEFDVRRKINNKRPTIDLELFTHAINLDWNRPKQGSRTGILGLQLFSQDNNNIEGTNTIPFVPNYNIYNIGLFGIETFTSNSTTYETGIRFDLMNMNTRGREPDNDVYREDLNFRNFTFTLGLIKQFNEYLSLRSNVGTAWRAPNISELYSFGKHESIIEYGIWRHELFLENDSISTQAVLTNELKEVKSERGLKWITTLTFSGKTVDVEITPHLNRIKNYFFTRPYGLTETVRGVFPYFLHDQTDALYAGVDMDVQKTWNENTNSKLKLSYVYAKDTRNIQKFVGIPPLNLQLSVEKTIGHFKIEFSPEYGARQSNAPPVISPEEFEMENALPFDRSGTFDFLNPPHSFLLLNVAIFYERSNFLIRLKGDNLLNTNYRRYTDLLRYYADDLGINLGLFLQYSF